jgi:hypothetical protein
MRRLIAFEQVSLDGFFVDGKGDMSWAHKLPVFRAELRDSLL